MITMTPLLRLRGFLASYDWIIYFDCDSSVVKLIMVAEGKALASNNRIILYRMTYRASWPSVLYRSSYWRYQSEICCSRSIQALDRTVYLVIQVSQDLGIRETRPTLANTCGVWGHILKELILFTHIPRLLPQVKKSLKEQMTLKS